VKKGDYWSERIARAKAGNIAQAELRILELVTEAGKAGIKAAEIAERTGRPRSSTQNSLIVLRQIKRIDCAGRGVSAIWTLPQWTADLDEAIKRKRIKRLIANGELTKAGKILAGYTDVEVKARVRNDDADEKPFVHRVVPAATAPRVQIKAPAWVFGLAQDWRRQAVSAE
jgi:hypothetical protein